MKRFFRGMWFEGDERGVCTKCFKVSDRLIDYY